MKNFFKIKSLKFLRYATILIYSLPVLASADNNQGFQITNPLSSSIPTTLTGVITAILVNIIEPLAAVAVVVMIIYSGFKYLTAQGNATKIKEAKQGLLYVLIGAGILLGAAAIAAAVQGTFNQLLVNP